MSNTKSKSQMVAIIGIFAALVIVLQAISYFVKIGTFSITLTLVPIIVAGVKYGPKYSTFLGAVFGVVTVIGCITGVDAGGSILFQASPIRNIILCMGKALLCGLSTGLVGTYLRNRHLKTTVIFAGLIAPIVNTGSFILLMFFLFKNILFEWAGGTDIVTYILVGLVGTNFIIEMAVNAVLSPIVYRVLKALKRYN